MVKKFIAHQSDKFTIERYFDEKGKSSVLEYFNALSSGQKKKLIHLFYLFGDIGKIFNKEKFRYEGNQIYAMKPSQISFCVFSLNSQG